jgi:hypothetical protein
MANYLTPEQEAEFKSKLGAPAENQPSPEAQPPVEDNGEAAAVDAAAAEPVAEPAPDPNAALLEQVGAGSVEELVKLYNEATGQSNQYKEMLSQILAFQQALDNQGEIDPDDPLNTVKKAVREEMAPIYEKLQREAQNKMVQEAWGKDAKNMPDLTDMMPEITAFIQEHPDLAVANDGLARAYHGVRSRKYKPESEMLKDKDFIERMASNEKIKDAVIKEYLATAARNGDGVPASIAGGGNVPLTGKKQPPNSMDQARKGLMQMLGRK